MFPMFLIQIVAVLAVCGLILWSLTQFPLDPTIAKFIRVCIIVLVGIWLIYVLLGLLGGGTTAVGPIWPHR